MAPFELGPMQAGTVRSSLLAEGPQDSAELQQVGHVDPVLLALLRFTNVNDRTMTPERSVPCRGVARRTQGLARYMASLPCS